MWRKKLEAKTGVVTIVRLLSGAPGGVPAGDPGAPAPPTAMSREAFSTLKASVEKESFSDGKLRVIQMSAASSWLSVAQIAELVDLVSQSRD